MSEADKASYKHIFKITSLFGGVQIIQVLSTIFRAKFAALLLGTVGMGISSLLVSSVNMIQTLCGLGLNYSAVRDISAASESQDNFKLSTTIRIFLKWLLFTGLLGSVVVVISSSYLSKYVFGNTEYRNSYLFLSLLVLFSIMSAGFQTLLQGTRRLGDLAKSNVIVSVAGVILVIPFYYFLKLDGIVPALLIASGASFFVYLIFIRRIKLENEIPDFHQTIHNGGGMVKLGIVKMFTALMESLTILLIVSFIKRNGSLSDVGLYQAGLNITSQSIGLVFTAMLVDYFPRLAAVNNQSDRVRMMANQQSEIMLLIITPILLLLIVATPVLIRIFLSQEFLPINNFIRLIACGMFFQAASYSMGLISFAKGDRKTFIALAIIGNSEWLLFTILGFLISGLLGVGIFFILHSALSFLITYYTANRKYKYKMSTRFVRLFFSGMLSVGLVCSALMFMPEFYGYLIGVLVLIAVCIYSILKLNNMIGFNDILIDLLTRYKIISANKSSNKLNN